MEKIYHKHNMEYGDKATLDKYSGKGGYQRARKDGFEKTYDLEVPSKTGSSALFDREICTINCIGHPMHGEDIVLRGWCWADKEETTLGLFLGAGNGILLYPQKGLSDDVGWMCELPKYTPSMLTKKRFIHEKTITEKTKILAERTKELAERAIERDRIDPVEPKPVIRSGL